MSIKHNLTISIIAWASLLTMAPVKAAADCYCPLKEWSVDPAGGQMTSQEIYKDPCKEAAESGGMCPVTEECKAVHSTYTVQAGGNGHLITTVSKRVTAKCATKKANFSGSSLGSGADSKGAAEHEMTEDELLILLGLSRTEEAAEIYELLHSDAVR